MIQLLLIQLLLGKGGKILSAFKQLVRVAVASASLLHFPVSERQMNNNDCCFYSAVSPSSIKHIFPVCHAQVFVSIENNKKRRLLNQESLCKIVANLFYCVFFQFQGGTLVSSLFSFLQGSIEKDDFYERRF